MLLPRKNKATNFLAGFLGILGTSCLGHAFQELTVYVEYPHLIRLNWGLPLLFGPSFFLYAFCLTNPDRTLKEEDFFGYIPYLLHLIIMIPFFVESGERKVQILDYFTAYLSKGTDHYSYYFYFLQIFSVVFGVHYALKTLQMIKDYRSDLRNEFSTTEQIRLKWLMEVAYLFTGVFIMYGIGYALLTTDIYPTADYDLFFYLSVFVLIYILAYKTIQEGQLHHMVVSASGNKKLDGLVKETEGNVSVFNTESKTTKYDKQLKELSQLLETDKPFLKGDLTATELADYMNISRHQLSELLNEGLGKSFYDFINTYRIEEFKKRLEMPEYSHLTLLGLALDSGFNSKTSFNTIFKKFTGETPSQYKKSLHR